MKEVKINVMTHIFIIYLIYFQERISFSWKYINTFFIYIYKIETSKIKTIKQKLAKLTLFPVKKIRYFSMSWNIFKIVHICSIFFTLFIVYGTYKVFFISYFFINIMCFFIMCFCFKIFLFIHIKLNLYFLIIITINLT